MNRSLLESVGRLRARGTLTDAQAGFFGRIARGELVSVRLELQIALWAGVTLVAAGAGILVKENLAHLGPVTIGAGIALAAALCLWYVARMPRPPFSWGPVASPTLAFDYVLLLGVLLIGTDLAYLETQYRLLGPGWPWHLLLLSLIQLAFAFRYDSRAVLSLALASFAAWRGVALSFAGRRAVRARTRRRSASTPWPSARSFVAAGMLLRRAGRKAHFEPAFGNLGLLLLLGAAVAGVYGGYGGARHDLVLGARGAFPRRPSRSPTAPGGPTTSPRASSPPISASCGLRPSCTSRSGSSTWCRRGVSACSCSCSGRTGASRRSREAGVARGRPRRRGARSGARLARGRAHRRDTPSRSIAADHASTGRRLGPIWRVLVFICVVVGVSTATTIGFISFGLRDALGVGADAADLRGGPGGRHGHRRRSLRVPARPAPRRRPRCSPRAISAPAVFVLLDDLHLHGHAALRLTYPWCAAVFAPGRVALGLSPLRRGGGRCSSCCWRPSSPAPARSGSRSPRSSRPGRAWRAQRATSPRRTGRAWSSRASSPSRRSTPPSTITRSTRASSRRSAASPAPRTTARASSACCSPGPARRSIPPAVLAWGLRSRDRALIAVGIVAAALSLTTIRFYIHVAPLWVVLAASGAALAVHVPAA